MKHLSLIKILFLSFLFFAFSVPALAASNLNDAFSDTGPLSTIADNIGLNKDLSITQVVGIVIQTLLSLLGVIFVILIIYAGFTWMTAEGDEAKVEKAQKIIRNSVIGLIIVISAYAISIFVMSALIPQTIAL